MTLHKVVNERLILIASSRVSPEAPVFDYLSEPAKSTMLNFPTQMWASPSAPSEQDSIVIVKMECDLDEFLFI